MDTIQKKQDDEYDFPYHYVSKYRNGFKQHFNDSWGINYVSTIEFLIQKISSEICFESIIDVGCGDGRLVKELREDFPAKRIQGIDFSQRAINLAKALNSAGEFYCKDITEKPDKRFDICTLIEVFEHIPPNSSNQFVEGIANHLNKSGILYVTVPHSNKPVEYKHYRHFTIKSLISCFSDHFSPVEIIPFESNGIQKRILDTLLTNKLFILNVQRLRNIIYEYYKKNLFIVSDEKQCNRIFIKFKKIG